MNWKIFSRNLLLTLALSSLAFSTGCATSSTRIGKAHRDIASAPLVDDAAKLAEQERLAARILPEQPADCGFRERSGVKQNDRLDAALLKSDQALGRANARVSRCAAWYKDLKEKRK